MELDIVNNIHEQIKNMLKAVFTDEQKPKLLIAEKYEKNNLMAGFFFNGEGSLCCRSDACYHALIIERSKTKSIIVNDCNPIPKEEPSLEA